MNQVLATAEDIGVKAFYTDTDSMMLQKSGVAKLREEYKNKYGRELIGKNLGEFSSDFEMAGCKNVKSVGFIGLGKKCYLHKLEGVDEKKEPYEKTKKVTKGVVVALSSEAKQKIIKSI